MQKSILLPILLLNVLFSAAQSVGISTTTPHRAKLEVHGAVGTTSAIFGGESTGVSILRPTPGIGFNYYNNGAGRYIGNGYAALQSLDPATGIMSFDFFGNGTANGTSTTPMRLFRLFPSGNVAIGTFTGNSTLTGMKLPGTEAAVNLYGTTHLSAFSYGAEEHTYIRAGKNNGIVFINDIPNGKTALTGYVGINTVNPEYALEIRQASTGGPRGVAIVEPQNFKYWDMDGITTAGASYFYLAYTGDGIGHFESPNGQYSAFSDRRVKTAIQPLSPVLQKIAKLQPVSYELLLNNPEHKETIGFIAQDVKELFPQLVSVSADTVKGYKDIPDLHSINYSGFGVIAIKAVQEQQEAIETQGESIAALHERMTKLEKWMNDSSRLKTKAVPVR
jgi:hypothetical protein